MNYPTFVDFGNSPPLTPNLAPPTSSFVFPDHTSPLSTNSSFSSSLYNTQYTEAESVPETPTFDTNALSPSRIDLWSGGLSQSWNDQWTEQTPDHGFPQVLSDGNVESFAETKKTKKSSGKSSTYKHIPHREKPVHLVARRNARERKRVQAVNHAFIRLRKVVPVENRNKRLSKVKTLHYAIQYIASLERLLAECDQQAALSVAESAVSSTSPADSSGSSSQLRHLSTPPAGHFARTFGPPSFLTTPERC